VIENAKKTKKSISESLSQAGPYLALGTQLAITIVILTFLGIFLDGKLHTKPVFILICTFFGAFAGLYNFIKTINALDKKHKNDKK
jgi:F0F1-type ATP synthase assembly protein I